MKNACAEFSNKSSKKYKNCWKLVNYLSNKNNKKKLTNFSPDELFFSSVAEGLVYEFTKYGPEGVRFVVYFQNFELLLFSVSSNY